MAKNFKELHDQVMSRPGAAERLAALRESTLAEIGLYELRKATGATQTDLAGVLSITQAAVSQLESSDDIKVSTLQKYVEALGGELRITAAFADTDVELRVG